MWNIRSESAEAFCPGDAMEATESARAGGGRRGLAHGKAIRTAPLSKHTSKEIFRPSHSGFSPLYQLLSHPYLLYIILCILSLFLSPPSSLLYFSLLIPFTGGR
jgi:hypothetical protein